ncbi:MAG: class I SAM-dependent methyltransferase [Phycisphaerae bacterium]
MNAQSRRPTHRHREILWWPEKRRLVFLGQSPTAQFWDREWQTSDWQRRIRRTRKTSYWRRIFARYIPQRDARILEAGCADGHLVDALNYWGYRAVGVDFGEETVKAVQEHAPDLDIRWGDVTNLEFDDASFDAYFSGGLIEHFWDGFERLAREMHRVLRPGGRSLVTFPSVSRLDKVKAGVSGYRKFSGEAEPDDFYQFGLDPTTVRETFASLGFACLAIHRRQGLLGMERVLPGFRRLHAAMSSLSEKNVLLRAGQSLTTRALAPLSGHSVLLVLHKR